MNEHKRTMDGPAPGPGRQDLQQEHVRSLYAAAYPPVYPSTGPSEELERRVAELAARHDAQAARPKRGWRLPLPWRYAAGATAAGPRQERKPASPRPFRTTTG